METALYDGDARHALTRWQEEEAAVKKSLLLRIQLLKTGAVQRRARAALAVAASLPETSEERETLLVSVRSAARSIAKEGTSWGVPLAALLLAGERHLEERDDEALAALDEAVAGFTETGMAAYRAAALVQRGRLLGGQEGARQTEEGLSWLAGQDVRNPEALAKLFAPGF
jgi:hypothetical protein